MHLVPRHTVEKSAFFCVPLLFSLSAALLCQEQKGLSFRGSAGGFGEMYSIAGITARRPHATGRVFIKGTADWDGLQFPIDVFLSSEDDRIRQTINRLSIGYANSWLECKVGDAFPVYSPLLLNGIFLRGGHLSAQPGAIRLQINAGMSQRGINADAATGRPGMYQRYLYAGRGGYDDGSINAIVHFLRAKDEIGSVTTGGLFSAPQENLIVGAQAGTNLFSNLQVKLELDRSLWTKDLRELRFDAGRIPGAFSSLFAERPSSTTGVAFRGDVSWRIQAASFTGMYQRISGGYYSTGVLGFQSDWEEFRLQGFAPLFNYTLNLSAFAGTKHDNLDGRKSATTRRTNGGINAGYRFDETYGLNTNYSFYFDRNDASNTAMKIDQSTHMIVLQPMRDWGDFQHRQHADLMIGYQSVRDNVDRPGGSFQFTRISLGGNYNRTFSSDLSAYVNYQFGRNKTNFNTLIGHALTAGAQYAIIPATFTTTGQLTISKESTTNNVISNTQYQIRLTGTYLVTSAMSLLFEFEGTSYHTASIGASGFTELRSSLTLSQQF